DREASWLENVYNVLHNLGRLLAGLVGRHVRLEGCIAAMRFRCDVHGEVMRRVKVLCGNNTVSRETAWSENVCIDARVGMLLLAIDVGQTASVGNNGSQGMTLHAELLW